MHHSPPKSWTLADPLGGDLGRPTFRLCANGHRLAHSILNLYVKHDGTPPKTELRRFPRVLVDMAQDAWDRADHSSQLPRTEA